MFSRFLVATDKDVDRYIVRDVDSRLNARDSLAVYDWIQSKMTLHSVRDHVNHCNGMNGGMWGGTKDAFPEMTMNLRDKLKPQTVTKRKHVDDISEHDYYADILWLKELWDNETLGIPRRVMQHDAYCCEKFPGSKPLPTVRPLNFQHVGQVFDGYDRPVMRHITEHLHNKYTPEKCRGTHQ